MKKILFKICISLQSFDSYHLNTAYQYILTGYKCLNGYQKLGPR